MSRTDSAQAITRAPIDLAGRRPVVTGDLTWRTHIDRRGRATVQIAAPTANGDHLCVALTFPDHATAKGALPASLEHFTTTTLANWDVPAPATVQINVVRGWYVTITRTPGALLPVIGRRRATGTPRPAWVRFEAAVVPSDRPHLTSAPLP